MEDRKIKLSELNVVIKGAGEMASAVAWRLFRSNIRKLLMLETASPLAVRREVSFCEAVFEGRKIVDGVEALRVDDIDGMRKAWNQGKIAVAVDSEWELLDLVKANVVVDAILAKKNRGTHINEAPLVIGLGPGFVAGEDVHLVVETNRGHNLGSVITSGTAEPNTGIPGPIEGFAEERVLRSPCDGVFNTRLTIGRHVKTGDAIGEVGEETVLASIDGVIRGLIRPSSAVRRGLKIGDIDPRRRTEYCYTISEKGRAIAGAVLEAILCKYN